MLKGRIRQSIFNFVSADCIANAPIVKRGQGVAAPTRCHGLSVQSASKGCLLDRVHVGEMQTDSSDGQGLAMIHTRVRLFDTCLKRIFHKDSPSAPLTLLGP
jgi:hypothetical protein